MANTAQARKRARQNESCRQHNASQRSAMRTSLKKATAVLAASNKEEATAVVRRASSMVDGMVSKGLIHKNKAARHKSRLNAKAKALTTAK